ncbi:unnamed protein product [Chironomus riparius]|uniref:Uncharacterized protein n=1 Tax=Chironomus riparius TaxID=315576 RepID=A0A9N9RWP7_9DIPT|nr:unnamed protein product [Chironomus riparius]
MYTRTNMLWTHRRNFCRMLDMRQLSSMLDIKPEVHDAIINKRAVVALESTIITHGMPYPHNLKTAMEVEDIVREQEKKGGNTGKCANVKLKSNLMKIYCILFSTVYIMQQSYKRWKWN